MATFGATAELSVPDSEIERARREIEDKLEVDVSVNTDTTTPTSSPGASRGGVVTHLEEQTDLLADILDELEDAGGLGRGGGSGGDSEVVPAVGPRSVSGGLLSALTLGSSIFAGGLAGLGSVNVLDRAGAFEATEGAGERVGEIMGPFREPIGGALARGLGPFGVAGAAAPGLSRGNLDRAESDVRAYGRTALQPPIPNQTILDQFGGGGGGSQVDPQALMNLGETGVLAGETVSDGELINEQTISRLESLELISDEQIQQLKSATSVRAGPDPDDEGALARVGTAQRQAGATTISGGETPSRIAARAVGSGSQTTENQQQSVEANVSVDENIQIDANIDDLEREIDSQLSQKLDKMKRDLMSELRRRFS